MEVLIVLGAVFVYVLGMVISGDAATRTAKRKVLFIMFDSYNLSAEDTLDKIRDWATNNEN